MQRCCHMIETDPRQPSRFGARAELPTGGKNDLQVRETFPELGGGFNRRQPATGDQHRSARRCYGAKPRCQCFRARRGVQTSRILHNTRDCFPVGVTAKRVDQCVIPDFIRFPRGGVQMDDAITRVDRRYARFDKPSISRRHEFRIRKMSGVAAGCNLVQPDAFDKLRFRIDQCQIEAGILLANACRRRKAGIPAADHDNPVRCGIGHQAPHNIFRVRSILWGA